MTLNRLSFSKILNMENNIKHLRISFVCILVIIITNFQNAYSQDDNKAAAKGLATQSQNPIASLISLPFDFLVNFNYGDLDKTQFITDIKPVLPFKLTDKWNVINRIIIPIIVQPKLTADGDNYSGLGNVNYTAFFVPPQFHKTSYGFGPSIIIPTRSNENLGDGEFAIGPSVVLFSSAGKWTLGFVAAWNHSYLNDNHNTFFAQYFINLNLEHAWSIGMSPTITADFNAAEDEKWTVPFGLNVQKVTHLGKQPTKFLLAGYSNAVKPAVGPDWFLEFAITFLFPK
jgi:hypothetical protein